ncbi:MAG: hypothetical protein QXU98_12390, partial [Candidatus Parvarchaeota archaeon]
MSDKPAAIYRIFETTEGLKVEIIPGAKPGPKDIFNLSWETANSLVKRKDFRDVLHLLKKETIEFYDMNLFLDEIGPDIEHEWQGHLLQRNLKGTHYPEIADATSDILSRNRFITTYEGDANNEPMFRYDGEIYAPNAEGLAKEEGETALTRLRRSLIESLNTLPEEIKGQKQIKILLSRLDEWIHRGNTRYEIAEILGQIRRQTYISPDRLNSEKDYIPVSNGLLHLQFKDGKLERTLEKFSPEHLFTYKLQIPYDPNAQCPLFEKTYMEVLGEQQFKTLCEYGGYVLYAQRPNERALVNAGPSGIGKGTFTALLQELLPTKTVMNISMLALSDESNRFAFESVSTTRLLVEPELTHRKLPSMRNFNTLIGDQFVTQENKQHPRVTIPANFKVVVNANFPLPKFSDDAPLRRLLILIWKKPANYIEDKNLLTKLKSELPGILNLFLSGLERLMRQNFVFTGEQSPSEVDELWTYYSDQTEMFIQECA